MSTILEAVMEVDKETAGTFRYKEVHEKGKAPVIQTIYVKKYLLADPEKAPARIKVTVEEVTTE